MPTPEILKDPRFDLFSANPEPMTSNRIGAENLNLFELIDQSTTGERKEKFAWTTVEAPKLGSTPRPTEAVPLPGLPAGFEETFRLLNAYIDENPVKELTIYVIQ
jgi:hypothetical protein